MASVDKAFVFVSIAIVAVAVGFASFQSSVETNQDVPRPPSIVQQQAPPGILEEEPVTFMELSNNEFSLPESRHISHDLAISGHVKNYERGTMVSVMINFPDDTEEELRLIAAKDGSFSTQIPITNEHPAGEYKVDLKYRNEKTSQAFSIIDENAVEEEAVEEIVTWEGMQIEQDKYKMPAYGQRTQVEVTGHVNDVDTSTEIIVSIEKPDDSIETLSVMSKRDGDFYTSLYFDDNSMEGIYNISAKTSQKDLGSDSFRLGEKDYVAPPTEIPDWIKNNAKWWASGQIPDSTFTNGIKYLLEEKVIDIPVMPASSGQGEKEIPEWVKNNAGWWADDMLTQDDFLNGIKYLLENGIISVNAE